MKSRKTITGAVDPDVLDYTVGDDPVLDLELAECDCLGTAAHVTMLSEMKGLKRPIVTKAEAARVRRELGRIGSVEVSCGNDDVSIHVVSVLVCFHRGRGV